MLAQAEHDKMASAILITDSRPFAEEVSNELERQLLTLPREETARASIDNNGAIIIVDDIDKAYDVANDIAPEHLELFTDNPFEGFTRVKNAGSVFLGKFTPEAVGDYWAGANHVLPTMGSAKFASALGVNDFVKRVQFMSYSESALNDAAGSIESFALSEGLAAHAESVRVRNVQP